MQVRSKDALMLTALCWAYVCSASGSVLHVLMPDPMATRNGSK
jgi:phage tail protein X